MMKEFYLVVGVDQDGDAAWDLTSNLIEANKVADEQSELAFERPKIYRVELPSLTVHDA
jgi:hypothetical protein